MKIGPGLSTNGDVWIEALAKYKDNHFNPFIVIGSRLCVTGGLHISAANSISIGNDCLIGSNVYIGDNLHGCYNNSSKDSSPLDPPASRELFIRGSVVIGDNVWIGNNVVILAPVVLPSGCIVGANSLVTGTFLVNSMIAGNPARCIKTFDSSLQKWKKTTPH